MSVSVPTHVSVDIHCSGLAASRANLASAALGACEDGEPGRCHPRSARKILP